MTNRVVTITLKKLDVTQLSKIRDHIDVPALRRGSNYRSAYMLELVALIDTMLDAGYSNKESTTTAPPMTL